MINPAFFKLAVGAIVAVVFFGLVIPYAILIWMCSFLSSCLVRIPEQFRKQKPGLVWLLLIPFFPVVWNFFVFPKIAESFSLYFAAQKKNDVGDCGYRLAIDFCICCACICFTPLFWIIPLVGWAIGLAITFAPPVLLILVLVKFSSLKARISAQASLKTMPVAVAQTSSGEQISSKGDPEATGGSRCAECGHIVRPGVKFCPQCGTAMTPAAGKPAFCTNCGVKYISGAHFCKNCGQPF
jgi:hypothetical protein